MHAGSGLAQSTSPRRPEEGVRTACAHRFFPNGSYARDVLENSASEGPLIHDGLNSSHPLRISCAPGPLRHIKQ
eukprot:160693-Pyramimonas_sp.AAC.1